MVRFANANVQAWFLLAWRREGAKMLSHLWFMSADLGWSLCYLNEARHEISRRCRHRRSCCHGGRCASADRKLQSPGGTEEACGCCTEVVHDEVREGCFGGLQ